MAPTKQQDENEPTPVDVSDIPEDRPEDPTLTVAINAANERLERKAALLREIQDSRQLCDLLVKSDVGSREQVLWVRTYMPRKLRKTTGTDGE
jgi:hypothetical protein